MDIIPTENRYQRRRRSSGFGSFLGKLLFFLLSLIPMCIIAWRIDLLGLQQPQAATVPVEQPRVVQRIEPQRVERPPRQVQRRPQVPIQPARQVRVQPENEIRRAPLRIEPVKLPETQAVTLDLTKKRQVEVIDANRLVRAPGTIEPSDGTLPATVLIRGARQVSLNVQQLNGRIQIEPTVVSDTGRSISFTAGGMARIRRGVVKQGDAAVAERAALAAEKEGLETWINARIAKSVAARGQARTRVMVIEKRLPKLDQQIAALREELSVVDSLCALADQLHESELHFAAEPVE